MNITESVSIQVFQSGSLVDSTRILADLTATENNERKMVALATATVLMGSAAMEAVFTEAAYVLRPSLYEDRKFRFKGAPEKYQELTGSISKEVDYLWKARKALAHSEPDNSRSRYVGELLNRDGVNRIINIVEDASIEVWGDDIPNWFREDSNIA